VPDRDTGPALVLPRADTWAKRRHLEEIARLSRPAPWPW
jgi:hypothetical protein